MRTATPVAKAALQYLWLYFLMATGAVYGLRLKTAPLDRISGRRRAGAMVLAAPLLILGLVVLILLIIGGLAVLWLLATSPILQVALGIAIVVFAIVAAYILATKARYG